MHVDFIIVGQGIAGSLLSFELLTAGKTVLVIDREDKYSASRMASAVINPLVARKWTVATDWPQYKEDAYPTYRRMEQLLGVELLHEQSLVVLDVEGVSRSSFIDQLSLLNPYLSAEPCMDLQHFFRVPQLGRVHPVYTVDALLLLDSWRDYLRANNAFMDDLFRYDHLYCMPDVFRYEAYTASAVIFCEGVKSRNNPFFENLPFTANRGDVLLLSIPGLPADYAFQLPLRLVPHHQSGLFWYGSNYVWQYDHLEPDMQWRAGVEGELERVLTLPFKTEVHYVAERPTTAGQQILFRQHSLYKNLYLLNGLGTRGFSAGPYWARYVRECLCGLFDATL